MVEIYNERIQDLLVDGKLKGVALNVRQSNDNVWVEGAKKAPCKNYS